MLVSVIIPVFNVEKYLTQCVESVLQQTYTDTEVILVDDGSTDSSPALCDAFAEQDARVRVMHKPNGGASDSRNAGLKIAMGDYIIFMDSDDFWASEDDLERLVKEAIKTPECDFIGSNCSYYYEQENKIVPWVEYVEEIVRPIRSVDCIEKLVASGTFPVSPCMKLIKRSRIQGKVEFIKGIVGEDIPWFIELLKQCDKCRFVNHYMYMYRKGITSVSSSFSYKKYSDMFRILRDGVEINRAECEGRTQDALFSFWAYELCILRAMTGFMDRKQRRNELKELYKYNWLMEYHLHPKVRKVALVQRLLGKGITNYLLHQYIKTRLV